MVTIHIFLPFMHVIMLHIVTIQMVLFFFNGVYHLFMQQTFPWDPKWKGGIGWGHLVSTDLSHWKEMKGAFVPGHWADPEYGVPNIGYFTGSATIVNGVPHIIFPAVFNPKSTKCSDTIPQACHMEYQYSFPLNISDPYLEDWSQPKTVIHHTEGVQPHGWQWEDPTHAWPDPTTPGRWLFIGQTNIIDSTGLKDEGLILQLFATKNGSRWTDGWTSLGDFFPSTGDQRCPGKYGCGGCCPEFEKVDGLWVMYGCGNNYWIGNYSYSSSDPNNQTFVPITNEQLFDMGDSTAAKGFWDDETNRYLFWIWIHGSDDHNMGLNWDSMMSVPRQMNIDYENMQLVFYPVEEVDALRSKSLISKSQMSVTAGTTVLKGVHGRQLDIVARFDWSHSGSVPLEANVGMAVLMGSHETTTIMISVTSHAYMANTDLPGYDYNVTDVKYTDPHICQKMCQSNAKCAAWTYVIRPPLYASCCLKSSAGVPHSCKSCTSGIKNSNQSDGLSFVVNRTQSTISPKVKNKDPIYGNIKGSRIVNMSIVEIRLLVDRSVIEGFFQHGSQQFSTRVYPNATDSDGVAIIVNGKGPLPLLDINVWEMTSCFA